MKTPSSFLKVKELTTAVVAFFLLCTFPLQPSAAAPSDNTPTQQSPTAPWTPPPPAKDEFDWIQLTSDEWLKGEIISLYDDTLEFDSDKLGVLKLDWEDVKQLRSGRQHDINLSNQQEFSGKIRMEGEKMVVLTDQGTEELNREETVAIVPHGGGERSLWKSKITLGLNVRSGNTDQLDYNLMASLRRRTAKNRLRLDYIGNLNKTDHIETSNNQRLTGQYDTFSSDKLFWRPFFGEYYKDPFQNISDRVTIGTGVGYHIIDTSKTEWDVFAGPAYQYTNFDSVEDGESSSEGSLALVLSTDYETEINKRLDFIAGYRVQLTNQASGGYSHHAITTLETELTDNLDFDISLIWDRIQHPTKTSDGATPERDDFKLIFGLGLDI